MKQIPPCLSVFRQTPIFTQDTVPTGLLEDHSTKPGVWGKIHVTAGCLGYHVPVRNESVMLDPDHPGVIEPEILHHVSVDGPVSFYVEFWR